MIDDFNSRSEDSQSSHETGQGDTNHQIRIHAYLYWAMTVYPQMKKYIPKILQILGKYGDCGMV